MNRIFCFRAGWAIATSCLIAAALYCASRPGAVAQDQSSAWEQAKARAQAGVKTDKSIGKALDKVNEANATLSSRATVRAIPGNEQRDIANNIADVNHLTDTVGEYTDAEMQKAQGTLKTLSQDPSLRYLECPVCHKRFMIDGQSASDKLRAIIACDRCEMSHVSKQNQETKSTNATHNQSGGNGRESSQQADIGAFGKAKQLAKEHQRTGSDTVTTDRTAWNTAVKNARTKADTYQADVSRFEQAKQLARVKLLQEQERLKQQRIAEAKRRAEQAAAEAEQMRRIREQQAAQSQHSSGLMDALSGVAVNMAISGALSSGSGSSGGEASSAIQGATGSQTGAGGAISTMTDQEKIAIYRH